MQNKSLFFASLIVLGLILFAIQNQLFNFFPASSWSLPLSGKIIYLDPGHGGPDGGAEHGEAVEKDIALNIASKLRDYLQQQGALVLMTREEDTDLANSTTKGLSRRKREDLQRRVEMINESEAELFISIHLNSMPSPRWYGAQTFYSTRYLENKVLAELIQEELRDNLENTKRVAKPIDHVYLVKSVKKPGALVEVGFLSNPTERELLIQDDYQEKVAAAIYQGVMRYFTEGEDRIKNNGKSD